MTIAHYDNEKDLTLLNKYMLTTENIVELNNRSEMTFTQSSKSPSKNILECLCSKKSQCDGKEDATNNVEALFTPKQNDKLFWCFYILLYGKIEYDYTTHIFETEKKFKIQSAEKLRDMKVMLRQFKLKYSDIEGELVSLPKITIKGIHALCILYKVSITYVTGNIYYILGNTNECASYKNCAIVEHSYAMKNNKQSNKQSNKQIGIQLEASDTYMENIRDTKIRVKNYNKPMLSIASYTVPVLHEMADILKINVYNDVGKKKLKKQLYQEVSEKII